MSILDIILIFLREHWLYRNLIPHYLIMYSRPFEQNAVKYAVSRIETEGLICTVHGISLENSGFWLESKINLSQTESRDTIQNLKFILVFSILN